MLKHIPPTLIFLSFPISHVLVKELHYRKYHISDVICLIFGDKQVAELRKLIAGTTHLPLENMTLVFRGNVLHDSTNGEDLLVQLNERGS